MSKYRPLTPVTGIQHIDQTFDPDTTQRNVMGTIVEAVDPYWGGGEFMYVYAAGTIRPKGLVTITPVFDSTLLRWRWEAAETANTANLGSMIGVAVLPMITTEYGWVQVGGMTPVNCQAAVAANVSFGIAAAGQGGAVAAGKQIVNARVVGASTITSVKPAAAGPITDCNTIGSFRIAVTNTDGWFVGGYVSGTGVGAAAIVTFIDQEERIVTVSVANSAAVTGNITLTYNNATIFYNVALLNRPFAQGAIT